MPHHREIVTALDAPAALGPYSHGVTSGGFLFCSGQVPLDPSTGELLRDSIAAETRRCLENLQAVCAAAGATLADAVRVTVYLTNMGAFEEMNEMYGTFFATEPPARVTIGVAGLPKGAQVEIEAVVALPSA